MEKQQAWNLIANVVSRVNANLDEHKTMQRAMELLRPKEEAKEEPKEE